MNNTIHSQMFPAITHTYEIIPSEKKVIKRFIFAPKLVNVEGDLHQKVWFCYVYEHHVKQPVKKTLYTEENDEIVVDTFKWVLDKTTLTYNEKKDN